MKDTFHRFAHLAANAVGSPTAFVLSLIVIVVWAITGPAFIIPIPGSWSSTRGRQSLHSSWCFSFRTRKIAIRAQCISNWTNSYDPSKRPATKWLALKTFLTKIWTAYNRSSPIYADTQNIKYIPSKSTRIFAMTGDGNSNEREDVGASRRRVCSSDLPRPAKKRLVPISRSDTPDTSHARDGIELFPLYVFGFLVLP